MQDAVDNTLELIAPIQLTLTANKTYNVGDQFVYEGLLYEVTATIASGTAITIGSNCQLTDTVAEQLTAINSNLTELENNDLGTAVDISNYTSTNMFTCPSDGYIVVNANTSGAVSSVAIVGSSGDPNNRVLVEASYATGRIIVPTLIRKGMMLYKNSGSGSYGMSFKPFV